MDLAQEIVGGMRLGLEAAGRRLLRADGIEIFVLLLRYLLDEQRVDAVGLVERLSERIDGLEIEGEHQRAVVQVEVDQKYFFLEARAEHSRDRDGRRGGADAAASADHRQGPRT